MINAQCLGLEDLLDTIKDFSERKSKTIINKGLEMAAEVSLEAAKDNAPVLSGTTKAAVHTEKIKRRGGKFGWKVQISEGQWTGKSWYAAAEDLGHHVGARTNEIKNLQKKKSKLLPFYDRRKWLEGKHWLEASFEETAEPGKNIAIQTIQAGIDKELKRLARKAARANT
jgi:hypothetical protein